MSHPPEDDALLSAFPEAETPPRGEPASDPRGHADAWNNDVMGTATVRDDDPGRNDFATTWAVYELSVAANPALAKGRAAAQG